MSSGSKPVETAVPGLHPAAVAIAGWLIPGAAHALVGRPGKAAVFFIALVAMFATGIWCGVRIFPLQFDDPLVLLEAVAEWLLGAPRIVAEIGGFGQGEVVAASYEYGNTFLIVAGLLNALVLLDAVDIAAGRKPAESR